MSRRFLFTAGALVAAGVSTLAYGAVSATPASTDATTAPLCRTADVSYYYGGFDEGLSQRTFQLTLIAHDGTRCRLSDQPLIALAGPSSTKVAISTGGRGGTLVISPGSPLHTSLSWHVPGSTKDTTNVRTLTLHMPGGGTANPEPFYFSDTTQISTQLGVFASAWTTGLGAGQESSVS